MWAFSLTWCLACLPWLISLWMRRVKETNNKQRKITFGEILAKQSRISSIFKSAEFIVRCRLHVPAQLVSAFFESITNISLTHTHAVYTAVYQRKHKKFLFRHVFLITTVCLILDSDKPPVRLLLHTMAFRFDCLFYWLVSLIRVFTLIICFRFDPSSNCCDFDRYRKSSHIQWQFARLLMRTDGMRKSLSSGKDCEAWYNCDDYDRYCLSWIMFWQIISFHLISSN